MITFKENLLYTKNNEWAENRGEVVRVGIDDYSQASLGDIVHIELPKNGTHVLAGQAFGEIEATKSVSSINAPVSGVVVRVNEAVKDSPSLVNIDPFGEGWLAEISPENFSELAGLMDVDTYREYIR
ncbi:MAG: glycine cleavage system protein GcvH [Synergistaceae bacterium]|nr:glycine cleavage system protein GcvH [Synergistaceae bacterium]MBR0034138.1 glycine cleavage system protein GcvH [Synergistaceae bacterium]